MGHVVARDSKYGTSGRWYNRWASPVLWIGFPQATGVIYFRVQLSGEMVTLGVLWVHCCVVLEYSISSKQITQIPA